MWWWIISFHVKLAAAVYILYKTWDFFISKRGGSIWNHLIPKFKRFSTKVQELAPILPPEGNEIMGTSRTAYLEPLAKPESKQESQEETAEANSPAAIKDEVQPQFEPEFDPDQIAEVVEYSSGPPDGLTREELLFSFDSDELDDVESSSGVSYQDMELTAEILKEGGLECATEENKLTAAITLHKMEGTAVHELFSTQIANAEIIARLCDEYIDSDGTPLKTFQTVKPPGSIKAFDIDKYV